MSARRRIVFSLVFLAATLAATGAWAQGGPTTLQFSFSNPGARSLGLGGAFVALADDATAAFANPAGLTQLTRPEVSIEARHWSYSTPYTVGGRISGDPTGIGLDGPIRTSVSDFDTSALSFLSFVYPIDKWTLAVSYHQTARFESTTETQGLFTDDVDDDPLPTCLPGTVVCRYPDVRRSTTVNISSTTLSAAYQVSEALSLGLGISYFQPDVALVQSPYTLGLENPPAGFFGPNPYDPRDRVGTGIYEFEDPAWGFNLGFLWFLDRQWSLGGFFRRGGQFQGKGVVASGPALDPPIPEGTVGEEDGSMHLEVPNVYGLGVAYRSKNGSWTASLEWDRVLYSMILESIGRSPLVSTQNVRTDDVSELRLGAEYAFRSLTPLVALRGGVWTSPDHTIRTVEDDDLERQLLPGGDDDFHYSLGLGVAFESFQIDLAVDFSDLVDTAALSLIYQF